jgi:DNA-binding XRE family transcriptional regulator
LRFCEVTLHAPKPIFGNPLELRSLGDHLKRRRLELGLEQDEAAKILGLSKRNYQAWEWDQKRPRLKKWYSISRFLAYLPMV